jgi:hypothetical protein
MEIERDIAYLDEDDKAFILEMLEDEVIESIVAPLSLRKFASMWYERGYEDANEVE